MERNRAEGWKHAKLSGHKNESLIEKFVQENISIISKKLHKRGFDAKVSVGGIKEENIPSILGNSTKNKSDLSIYWEDNTKTNISIKKSRGGQVYLIGTQRFIEGFERLFNQLIPNSVKEALFLFFGDNHNIPNILKSENIKNATTQKIYAYQQRKHRLVWDTLELYDRQSANEMLSWFKKNIDKITIFCFASGLAKDRLEWADFIWYKNLLGEDDMDLMISISLLSQKVKEHKEIIKPGTRGGGTTIQLPFGFVQWHQGKMQFHHKYEAIKNITVI